MTDTQSLVIKTPIGFLRITASKDAIVSISFVEKQAKTTGDVWPHLQDCAHQIEEYFAGTRKVFENIPLLLPGDSFRSKVWQAMLRLPYGHIMTYGGLAMGVENPGAVRAVGSACRTNPFIIVVPCHRIVPSNLDIGNYAGGVERKQWLLSHEEKVLTEEWTSVE